jgi:hypothetical protein
MLVYEFESQDLKIGTAHTTIAPADTAADAASDMPLTLSQLSPRKGREEKDPPNAPTPSPLAKALMSPLRPPSKRPVSVASEKNHRKRSRGNDDVPLPAIATAAKTSGSSGSTSKLKARLPSTRKRLERNQLSGSSSNRSLDGGRMRGKVTKERGSASTAHTRVSFREPPAFNPGSRKLKGDEHCATKSTNLSLSSGVSTSSKLRVARPQWDDTTEPVKSSLLTQGKKDSKGSSCLKPVRSFFRQPSNSLCFCPFPDSRIIVFLI